MTDYQKTEHIPLFFIVGRARSGTTLLQTMMDANAEVIVPGESCFLMHLKNKYAGLITWTNATIDIFLTDLVKEKKLQQFWNLDLEAIRSKLYSIPMPARNFQLFCKIIYLNYPSVFNKKNIQLIGDKNPVYSLFIKDILQVFPSTKFIHLVRDYRANTASNREVFSMKNIAVLAHAWKYHNRKIEQAKLKYPERFLQVRYEDLTENTAYELQRICRFLNIPYNEAMLGFHEKVNEQLEGREEKQFRRIHSNLLNPVNSNKVNAWKKNMSDAEVLLTEYIAGNDGMRYSYLKSLPPKKSASLFFESLLGRLRNRLMCTVIKVYYYSPLAVKDILSAGSLKMNTWFNLKNHYNQTDFVE